MPYITQEKRVVLDNGGFPESAGELNYKITKVLLSYWLDHYSYQGINDIIGALEGAKAEFYRRVVVPYEEQKRQYNGDVY